MTVKEFIRKYNNIGTNSLKEKFFKEEITIKTYIPYLTKLTLAEKLVNITILENETGNIKVNSTANYLFFCRTIIEQYTNLKIETDGFFEEYDLLNQSGVLDKIMQSIPEKEINEFKTIVDMKKNDIIVNFNTPQAYINHQIERITSILGITLKPILEKISEQLDNLDEKNIEKLSKSVERIFKKIK